MQEQVQLALAQEKPLKIQCDKCAKSYLPRYISKHKCVVQPHLQIEEHIQNEVEHVYPVPELMCLEHTFLRDLQQILSCNSAPENTQNILIRGKKIKDTPAKVIRGSRKMKEELEQIGFQGYIDSHFLSMKRKLPKDLADFVKFKL